MQKFDQILDKARCLREKLHEIPELSMKEVRSKKLLMDSLKEETSLRVVDRKEWFYVLKKGKDGSFPAIAFRADYDAVCGKDGLAGHYCGHDGHSACLFGLALMLSEMDTPGDVYLIFQPGEETGEGALLCKDLLLEENISMIFGYHNIPGHPKGHVLIREGTFALASTGLEISMIGSPAHAAYPNQGKNPALAVARLLLFVDEYLKKDHEGILLSTVIGVDLGSDSYGVSASKAVVRLTVRGEIKEEYEGFLAAIEDKLKEIRENEGLEIYLEKKEPFTVTSNAKEANTLLINACKEAGLSYDYLDEPLRWSEDFGVYLKYCKGAFFGVGMGEDYPGLHTKEYEFDDSIIENVLMVYKNILNVFYKSGPK